MSNFQRAVHRHALPTAVLTLGAVGVAAAVSLTATPEYTSTATVSAGVDSVATGNALGQGSEFTANQMSSWAELATTPSVLDPVIDDLNLDVSAIDLAEALDVTVVRDTTLIDIAATDTDAATAARLANAVADRLVKQAKSLAPQGPDKEPILRMDVVAKATALEDPSGPNTPRNVGLGLLAGVALSGAVGLFRESRNSALTTVSDIAAAAGSPVLGELSTVGGIRPEQAGVQRLWTALTRATGDQDHVVAVAELGAGGAAVALARALGELGASAGHNVMLVDADLRSGSLTTQLDVSPTPGVVEALRDPSVLAAANPNTPNGAGSYDVLGSPAEAERGFTVATHRNLSVLLRRLGATRDLTVVVTPASDVSGEALPVAAAAGAVLLLVPAGIATSDEVARFAQSFTNAGARVLGVAVVDGD